MRHLTIRLLAVAAVAAVSLPAYAQSPIQLRFDVQPASSDPIWQNFKGQTLEKYAECYYSNDASRPAGWNPGRSNIFSSKTVLFNPGNTTWSGGKQVFTPNTPPEPTNTLLMLPVGLTAQTKGIVCRARILANGQNVTANANDIVFRLTEEVAKAGPPTASVKLDVSKAPKPAPQTANVSVSEVQIVGTKFIISAANPQITIDKSQLPPAACGAPLSQAFFGCYLDITWTLKRDNSAGVLQLATNLILSYNAYHSASIITHNLPKIPVAFVAGADSATTATAVPKFRTAVPYVHTGPQKQLPGGKQEPLGQNCANLSFANAATSDPKLVVNKAVPFKICINNK